MRTQSTERFRVRSRFTATIFRSSIRRIRSAWLSLLPRRGMGGGIRSNTTVDSRDRVKSEEVSNPKPEREEQTRMQ